MKTLKSGKTTESKKETTIVATVEVTIIMNGELSDKEAKGVVWDVVEGIDVDKMEFKNIKRFVRED